MASGHGSGPGQRPPYLGQQQVPALHQKQMLIITPPIANSEEEAAAHARHYQRPTRELSDEVLGAVSSFIGTEDSRKPYTDGEIWNHLQGQGYEVALRDVSYARHRLGVEASALRRMPL